jgi:HD-like signal output (HDOD) protein
MNRATLPAALEAITPAQLQDRVRELPALPEAVLEVLQVLRSDRLSAERCVHLIELDAALATRTLRLANSAFYGVAGRVARISDAVAMLGLRTVSGALAAAALTQAFPQQACPGFALADHWRHAVATALCARSLAPLAGLDAEEAFLAGLMHDFGSLVLATQFPRASAAAHALAAARPLPLHEAEAALLGVDHAEVGALLAAHWHFPPPMVRAIACHHAPPPADAAGVQLDGLLQWANSVARGLNLGTAAAAAPPPGEPAVWSALALDAAAALALSSSVEHSVHEMCAALHL